MKKILMLVILSFVTEVYSQDFHQIILPVTKSYKNINYSKQEHFIVLNDYKLDKNFLDKCELFCDSIRKSDTIKYFESTYIFYKNSKSLNKNTNISYINLIENHKNDHVAILQYIRRKNKPVKKAFLLLDNGNAIKCFVNGVERKKRE